MSTLENLKAKVKVAATATVDATKQFAIISKCKLKIAAEQDKIRKLYAKLGKLYYKDFITDEEPDEAEYKPLCDSISDHYRQISYLRARLEEAKTNYQSVKEEDKEIKDQAAKEEDRLIDLAFSQAEAVVSTVVSDEDVLLEELNSLNNEPAYGEILD